MQIKCRVTEAVPRGAPPRTVERYCSLSILKNLPAKLNGCLVSDEPHVTCVFIEL
jgi:hypothetical protein